MKKQLIILLGSIVLFVVIVGYQNCGNKSNNGESQAKNATKSIAAEPTITDESKKLSEKTVENQLSTFEVLDKESPLFGLKITTPESDNLHKGNLKIGYFKPKDFKQTPNFPSAAKLSPTVLTMGIEMKDNENKRKNSPALVTIPLSKSIAKKDIVNIYQIGDDGSKVSVGLFNRNDQSVSFLLSYDDSIESESANLVSSVVPNKEVQKNYIAVGIDYADFVKDFEKSFTIGTSFKPEKDGWAISNYGSYLTSGGNCFGMTSFARYFFLNKTDSSLRESYRDKEKSETNLDDGIAYELATRLQLSYYDAKAASGNKLYKFNTYGDRHAYSLLGALYLDGTPQLIHLENESRGHSVMTYKAEVFKDGSIRFYVYDPNITYSKNKVVKIIFHERWIETGFDPYLGDINSEGETSTKFTTVRHSGYLDPMKMEPFKKLADQAVKEKRIVFNNSIFPEFRIESLQQGDCLVESENDCKVIEAEQGEGGYPVYHVTKPFVTVKGSLYYPQLTYKEKKIKKVETILFYDNTKEANWFSSRLKVKDSKVHGVLEVKPGNNLVATDADTASVFTKFWIKYSESPSEHSDSMGHSLEDTISGEAQAGENLDITTIAGLWGSSSDFEKSKARYNITIDGSKVKAVIDYLDPENKHTDLVQKGDLIFQGEIIDNSIQGEILTLTSDELSSYCTKEERKKMTPFTMHLNEAGALVGEFFQVMFTWEEDVGCSKTQHDSKDDTKWFRLQ